ncbi:MAG TPA: hypothetical protein VGB20_03050 [bacterium]
MNAKIAAAIEAGRVVEHVWNEDAQAWQAFRINFVPGYDGTQEDRGERAAEHDLTPEQSRRLKAAMGERAPPAIGEFLGERVLLEDGTLDHMAFLHAGRGRQRVYAGSGFFRDLLAAENADLADFLAHEFLHLDDPAHADDPGDPRYQRLLNRALIHAAQSDAVSEEAGSSPAGTFVDDLESWMREIRPLFAVRGVSTAVGSRPYARFDLVMDSVVISTRLSELLNHSREDIRANALLTARIELLLQEARNLARAGQGEAAHALVTRHLPEPPLDDARITQHLSRLFVRSALPPDGAPVTDADMLRAAAELDRALQDFPYGYTPLKAVAGYLLQGAGEDGTLDVSQVLAPWDLVQQLRDLVVQSGVQDERLDAWWETLNLRWVRMWNEFRATFAYDELYVVSAKPSGTLGEFAPRAVPLGVEFRLTRDGLRAALEEEFQRMRLAAGNGDDYPAGLRATVIASLHLPEAITDGELISALTLYAIANPHAVIWAGDGLSMKHWGLLDPPRLTIDGRSEDPAILEDGWQVHYPPRTFDGAIGEWQWLIAPDLSGLRQPRVLSYKFGIRLPGAAGRTMVWIPDPSVAARTSDDPVTGRGAYNSVISIARRSRLHGYAADSGETLAFDRLTEAAADPGGIVKQVNLDAEAPPPDALEAAGYDNAIQWLTDHLDGYRGRGYRTLQLATTLMLSDLPWLSGYAPAAYVSPYGRPVDVRQLMAKAEQLGMAIDLDFVGGHTSPHAWPLPAGAYLWTLQAPELIPVFSWGRRIDDQRPDATLYRVWILKALGATRVRGDVGHASGEWMWLELARHGIRPAVNEGNDPKYALPFEEIYYQGARRQMKVRDRISGGLSEDVSYDELADGLRGALEALHEMKPGARLRMVWNGHDMSQHTGGTAVYVSDLDEVQRSTKLRALFAAMVMLHLTYLDETSLMEYSLDDWGVLEPVLFMYGGETDREYAHSRDEAFKALHDEWVALAARVQHAGRPAGRIDTGDPFVAAVEVTENGRRTLLVGNLSRSPRSINDRLPEAVGSLDPYEVRFIEEIDPDVIPRRLADLEQARSQRVAEEASYYSDDPNRSSAMETEPAKPALETATAPDVLAFVKRYPRTVPVIDENFHYYPALFVTVLQGGLLQLSGYRLLLQQAIERRNHHEAQDILWTMLDANQLTTAREFLKVVKSLGAPPDMVDSLWVDLHDMLDATTEWPRGGLARLVLDREGAAGPSSLDLAVSRALRTVPGRRADAELRIRQRLDEIDSRRSSLEPRDRELIEELREDLANHPHVLSLGAYEQFEAVVYLGVRNGFMSEEDRESVLALAGLPYWIGEIRRRVRDPVLDEQDLRGRLFAGLDVALRGAPHVLHPEDRQAFEEVLALSVERKVISPEVRDLLFVHAGLPAWAHMEASPGAAVTPGSVLDGLMAILAAAREHPHVRLTAEVVSALLQERGRDLSAGDAAVLLDTLESLKLIERWGQDREGPGDQHGFYLRTWLIRGIRRLPIEALEGQLLNPAAAGRVAGLEALQRAPEPASQTQEWAAAYATVDRLKEAFTYADRWENWTIPADGRPESELLRPFPDTSPGLSMTVTPEEGGMARTVPEDQADFARAHPDVRQIVDEAALSERARADLAGAQATSGGSSGARPGDDARAGTGEGVLREPGQPRPDPPPPRRHHLMRSRILAAIRALISA